MLLESYQLRSAFRVHFMDDVSNWMKGGGIAATVANVTLVLLTVRVVPLPAKVLLPSVEVMTGGVLPVVLLPEVL